MEGYICINGNKTLLTPEQIKELGFCEKPVSVFRAWLLCVTPCGTALFLSASSSAT